MNNGPYLRRDCVQWWRAGDNEIDNQFQVKGCSESVYAAVCATVCITVYKAVNNLYSYFNDGINATPFPRIFHVVEMLVLSTNTKWRWSLLPVPKSSPRSPSNPVGNSATAWKDTSESFADLFPFPSALLFWRRRRQSRGYNNKNKQQQRRRWWYFSKTGRRVGILAESDIFERIYTYVVYANYLYVHCTFIYIDFLSLTLRVRFTRRCFRLTKVSETPSHRSHWLTGAKLGQEKFIRLDRETAEEISLARRRDGRRFINLREKVE